MICLKQLKESVYLPQKVAFTPNGALFFFRLKTLTFQFMDFSPIFTPIEKIGQLVFKSPRDLFPFINKELGVSDWTIITQELIQQFANATGDHQWIHLDAERCARESPFKKTIAHGMLTLSLLPQWINAIYTIENITLVVNYGFNRVRFIQPVLSNSKLRMRCTLQNIELKNGAYTITHSCVVEMQNIEKPVCIAEWLSVVC